MFLHRIETKAIIPVPDLHFISKKHKAAPRVKLSPAALNVIQMTAQIYFHLAINVTITPMSATFTVLSFVSDMLANWEINLKNWIILGYVGS